jgi:hypothetical protein
MIAALTGMGLSAAAGLNAYIPFLAVGLLARFTDLIVLPAGFTWIESGWALGIGAVLLLAELVLDKVPAVDTVNDVVATLIRPSMGGLVFAASSAARHLDESSWLVEHPWVGVVLGVAVSGIVHAGKTSARPVVNAATLGVGAPLVSTAEDTASVGLSIVSVLWPALVIVALALLVWVLVLLLRVRRRWREPRTGPVRLRPDASPPGP